MSLTEQIKRRIGFDSTKDEVYYLKVVHELEAGIKREGLWAKALAESDGDSDKAHAKYIRLRALSLKEEDARTPKTTSQSPQQTAPSQSPQTTAPSTESLFPIWITVAIVIVLFLGGIWTSTSKTGAGTLDRRPDGSVVYSSGIGEYVGEFSDSKFNGFGTYTYYDGRTYRGEWKDDKYNGQGTMTYPDGRVESGRWENGAFLGP